MASASAPRWKLPSSPPCGALSTSSTGSTPARRWSFPCWQQKARLRLLQGAETLERRTRHEADQGSRDGWHRSARHHVASRYQAVSRTQVHVGIPLTNRSQQLSTDEQEEHTDGSTHRFRNRLLRRHS